MQVVHEQGGDPAQDLVREGVIIRVRIWSGHRASDGQGNLYIFRLDHTDYDDEAPRLSLCDPEAPERVGKGKDFYPIIHGNTVFNHADFFCMPGDRRCYQQHPEWRRKEHFHPEVVIGSLFALLRHPGYRGRA